MVLRVQLWCLAIALCTTHAFVVVQHTSARANGRGIGKTVTVTSSTTTQGSRALFAPLPVRPWRVLQATDNNDEELHSKPRRRKRRIMEESSSSSISQEGMEKKETVSAASSPPRPRPDDPVALAVTDVRSLMGGGSASKSTTSADSNGMRKAPTVTNLLGTISDSSTSTTTTTTPSSTTRDRKNMESLEQLLLDAREMQALGEGDDDSSSSVSRSMDGANEASIPKMISSVLSTIVTVDFFVVCAFLLWFLAGIFSSYVLHDDTVQIAFNSNFEKLVQPALGILMIAAVAGNFFQEDEEA